MAVIFLHDSPSGLQQHGPRIRISISAPLMEVEEGKAVGLEYPRPLQLLALIDTGLDAGPNMQQPSVFLSTTYKVLN
jgi:hypothetical protein